MGLDEARALWRGFFCDEEGGCDHTPDEVFQHGFDAGIKEAIQRLKAKLTKEPSDYNVGINNAILILDDEQREEIEKLLATLPK